VTVAYGWIWTDPCPITGFDISGVEPSGPIKTLVTFNLLYLEKIVYAYEITLLSLCVCLCISPIVAGQRLGKNSLIVARKRLGRNVTAVTNTHVTIEELLYASFSMWSLSYLGK
jgi:hypothetical protein